MRKYKLLLLPLVFCVYNLQSQTLEELVDYDWNDSLSYVQYNDTTEDIISCLDKIIIDFEYEKSGDLIEYYLAHQAYILNSDEKIESYNKLYLPMNSSSSVLLKMKARVITKSGEKIELDDSKILTSKDEETKREYKYYAFEGVEKGSIIEYFYLVKKIPSYSGKKITLQDDYPKYNIIFDLYSPNNLVFSFKSYNGLKEVERDTLAENYLHWQLNVDTLVKLEPEELSAYNSNLQYLIYKLDRNTANNAYNLSAYSTIAKNVYNRYYEEKPKAEIKTLNKLIKENKFKIARNQQSMIRAIEDHLKQSYYVVDVVGNPELDDLSKIVTNKVASYHGIVKLYTSLFDLLDIKHQIVLTSNRFELKFDKEFESANYLTDYLIYFPDIKMYLSPIDIGSRLGFPPFGLTNNYGMFIKTIEVNELKTALSKIKFIEPVDYDKSFDEILINIDLDGNDLYESKVTCDRSTGGYYAANIQPYMNLFKEENKKEIIDEYVKFIDPDINIESKKVYYDDSKYFGIEPFKVTSVFNIDPFIESAGNSYIFKVGKLIGPQVEMYQEKERVLPIENQYKRNYHRVIKINVPEKYSIKNLDKLNIHNEYKKDGKILMYFKSSYTFNNNVLEIIVDEYYDVIELEASLYDTYRKIINSAADFNKVSLIVEK